MFAFSRIDNMNKNVENEKLENEMLVGEDKKICRSSKTIKRITY